MQCLSKINGFTMFKIDSKTRKSFHFRFTKKKSESYEPRNSLILKVAGAGIEPATS